MPFCIYFIILCKYLGFKFWSAEILTDKYLNSPAIQKYHYFVPEIRQPCSLFISVWLVQISHPTAHIMVPSNTNEMRLACHKQWPLLFADNFFFFSFTEKLYLEPSKPNSSVKMKANHNLVDVILALLTFI